MYQLNQIPSEAQIKKYIRRILFGKNVFCPRCSFKQVVRYEDRYRCKRCRLKFSLLSCTWLKNIKLPYQRWWLLLWCWTKEIPVKQAMELTELSNKAIRHWYRQFRIHLPPNLVVLERVVQLDEVFFKNQSLMMAKQPGTRNLAWMMLSTTNVQRQHAATFLEQNIKPNSQLNTDGASIYRGIERWWPVDHQRDIHSKWEFGLTSEIEGMFGNLRTFIRRMYHHTRPEQLPEYVGEFCYRFSSPETFKNPLNYLNKSLKLVPTRY